MNPIPTPPYQGPMSELILSAAEADELIPLTIPLDRPEPIQSQLSTASPEQKPQPLGELARVKHDQK